MGACVTLWAASVRRARSGLILDTAYWLRWAFPVSCCRKVPTSKIVDGRRRPASSDDGLKRYRSIFVASFKRTQSGITRRRRCSDALLKEQAAGSRGSDEKGALRINVPGHKLSSLLLEGEMGNQQVEGEAGVPVTTPQTPLRVCYRCGATPINVQTLLDPRKGKSVWIMRCQCGEQTWSEGS